MKGSSTAGKCAIWLRHWLRCVSAGKLRRLRLSNLIPLSSRPLNHLADRIRGHRQQRKPDGDG